MRLITHKFGFCKLVSKQFKSAFEQPSFAKLNSRSFIIVYGPDTKKFLQGITTNNISQLYEPNSKFGQRISQYNLFLDAKGKIVADGIIIRPLIFANGKKVPADNELWIDVSKQLNTSLHEHLRKYMWKKQVDLNNLIHETEKPDIHVGYNKVLPRELKGEDQIVQRAGREMDIESDNSAKDQNVDDGAYANFAFFDPRAAKLGVRMVCGPEGFKYQGEIKKTSEEEYQKICRLNGISSSTAMTNKLPFMFNSDLFKGFSFNKGCYLGQQIVARAYHTGIVRRRIFPFILQDSSKKIQSGTILTGENNTQIGKVVESYPGYGTVLSSYLPLLSKQWPLKITSPCPGEVDMPFESELKKYIAQIQAKQTKLSQIDL